MAIVEERRKLMCFECPSYLLVRFLHHDVTILIQVFFDSISTRCALFNNLESIEDHFSSQKTSSLVVPRYDENASHTQGRKQNGPTHQDRLDDIRWTDLEKEAEGGLAGCREAVKILTRNVVVATDGLTGRRLMTVRTQFAPLQLTPTNGIYNSYDITSS